MSQPEPDPTHPTPGMALWGWMSPTELEWLASQASQMRSVVEIGCLHGRSSFALATACPGHVYCIDPWNDAGWKSWSKSMRGFDNVTGIRAASPDAGRQVPDPVDMVFIDGAHDYASVKADIEYWLPRTRRLLCGHDYIPFSALQPGESAGFPDVKTAVDDLLGEIEVAPDTAIWTYEVPMPKLRDTEPNRIGCNPRWDAYISDAPRWRMWPYDGSETLEEAARITREGPGDHPW